MKSRFRLSANVCLLTTVAAGIVIGPRFALLAQTGSHSNTSATQRHHQHKLGSAVQRELEKLHAREGKRAPKLTAADALRNLQQSRQNAARQSSNAKAVAPRLNRTSNPSRLKRIVPIANGRSSARPVRRMGILQAVTERQSQGQRQAPKFNMTTSATPRTARRISKSVSSSKSVTAINKGMPSVQVRRNPVVAKPNTKATVVAKPKFTPAQPARVAPTRLFQSIAKKSAQLIRRPSNDDTQKSKTSLSKSLTSTNSRRTTYSSTRRQRRVQQERTDGTRPSAVARPANIGQTVQVHVPRPQQKPTSSAAPRSDILKQLEQLYKRDGKPMPSMDLAKQSKSRRSEQQAAQAPKRPQMSPKKNVRTASASNFFKRFLRLNPKRRLSASKEQRRSTSKTTLPQPVLRQPSNTTAKKLAPGSVAAREPGKLPASPSSQTAKVSVTPKSSKQVDKKATEPKQNPFSGLKLTDTQPKNPLLIPPQDSKNAKPLPSVAESSSTAKDQESGKPRADQNPKSAVPKINPLSMPKNQIAAKSDKQSAKKPVNKLQDASQHEHADKYKKIAERTNLKGMKGFCPVALRDQRDLVDSHPDFSSVYKSKVYSFSSVLAKARFESDPISYTPVADGNNVVLLARTRVEIEGALDHAAWYRGRLYLFSSSETHSVFVANPDEYVLFD